MEPVIEFPSLNDSSSKSNYQSIFSSSSDDVTIKDEAVLSHNKQVAVTMKLLKALGIVKIRGKYGYLLLCFIVVLMWIPVVLLGFCVKKAEFTMASPSGLPTILLFMAMALSQHCGMRYGTGNSRILQANLRFAFERGNLKRNALILLGISIILHGSYLGCLLYLYLSQPLPVPWLQIFFVYFLGYGYCSLVCIAMHVVFSAACCSMKIKIFDLQELLNNWDEGLTEALDYYNDLCTFINEQVEAIKWWVLCNLISFAAIWIVDFHLWQMLFSRQGSKEVIHLVFYNCSCTENTMSRGIHVSNELITGCEVMFSMLVFFLFTSPLYWAAMVTVECNRFREWVNQLRIANDETPLGKFSVASLDFFTNRVQAASYFAFRLFGINITKLLYSVTGLMTTAQVALSVVANKLLPA